MNDDAKAEFNEVLAATKKCRSWKERREKLLELGFEFYEDDDAPSEQELREEKGATPHNARQQRLVNYLESNDAATKALLDDFMDKKASENTNYALFRRYFRKANIQLRKLILYGLDVYPTKIILLDDLSFLSYFAMELAQFIQYYTRACVDEQDITLFKEIVQKFEHGAIEYEYDAYADLLLRDEISPEKKSVVKNLLEKPDEGIEF